MARTGLAVGGAVLVLLGGSALTWGNFDTAEARTTALRGIDSIRIDGGSGSVDIRRGARAEVRQRENRWWNGWGGDGPETRHRVADGELVLNTDCGWNCDVDYVVTLPSRVPVTGSLDSGSLDVTGMSAVDVEVDSGSIRAHRIAGAVTARTDSGGIDLARVGGKVDVETGSGRIEGEELRGADVTAHTGSGGVSLELTSPRTVDVETGSGRIDVTVPRGPYSVRADTASGSENIEVARDPDAERRLELSTGSGSIDVDRA